MSTLSAAAILACTSVVAAQNQVGTVTHHLSFHEVDAVSGLPVPQANGVIEPGEGARVRLAISFTPDIGAIVNLPVPPFEPRTVVGLGKSFLTMHAQSGSWRQPQLAPGWESGPGQFSGNYGNLLLFQDSEEPDTRNPVVDIWQGTWVPATYTDRGELFWTYPFGIGGAAVASALWLEGPGPEYSLAPANTTTAQMQIPISSVPGPGVGAVVIGLGMLGARRRR